MEKSIRYSDHHHYHQADQNQNTPPETDGADAIREAVQILATMTRDCQAPGTVLAILAIWMTDLQGRPIGGRSGDITYLCQTLKRSRDTVCRALHQIADHPVLGQALRYQPKHAGGHK